MFQYLFVFNNDRLISSLLLLLLLLLNRYIGGWNVDKVVDLNQMFRVSCWYFESAKLLTAFNFICMAHISHLFMKFFCVCILH